MAGFGQKLSSFLKDRKIKAAALADHLHVHPSLVSKWIKGERVVERDSFTLPALTRYLARRVDASDDVVEEYFERICLIIRDWLYDGSDVMEPVFPFLSGQAGQEAGPVQQGYAYLGMDGILVSLGFLGKQLKKTDMETGVYISSEYSMLLTDPQAAGVWEQLYQMNGKRPVRVVFEQWKDKDRTAQITKCLMPFLHAGKMELLYLISSQRFLCYNAVFYADGTGMVMTTEPAGEAGSCVSIYLDNKSFIRPMGNVLDKLSKMAVPMLRVWDSVKNRGAMESRFYDEILFTAGDLDAVHYGAHLIYLSPDTYERLLKLNKLPAARIRFRKEKFIEQKKKTEVLLQANRCREVYRFDLLDGMVQTGRLHTTDLFFANLSELVADEGIIKELLEGMVVALRMHDNLHMMLVKDGLQEYGGVSWRVKDDKFLLMHTAEDSMKSVSSDNWLLCRHYMRNFEEIWDNNYHAVHGKKNVIDALELRIKKLGRQEV